MIKTCKVVFADEKIRKRYEKLRLGNSSDRLLYKQINKAIEFIKENPYCGIRIKKEQIPKIYRKNNIDVILKYDLPKGWRMIYSIFQDELYVLAVIIEWFNHKNYEKRFNYMV